MELDDREILLRRIDALLHSFEEQEHLSSVDASRRFFESLRRAKLNGWSSSPPRQTDGSELETLSTILQKVSRSLPTMGLRLLFHRFGAVEALSRSGKSSESPSSFSAICEGQAIGGCSARLFSFFRESEIEEMPLARRSAEGWILQGEETHFLNGSFARMAIVLARVDPEPVPILLAVDPNQEGAQILPAPSPETLWASVRYRDCLVPVHHFLKFDASADASMIPRSVMIEIGIASVALGIARRSFDEAVALLRSRRRPPGQGEMWPMADCATDIDAASLLIDRCIEGIHADEPIGALSGMAGVQATQVARVASSLWREAGGLGKVGSPDTQMASHHAAFCSLLLGGLAGQHLSIADLLLG